MNAIDRYWARFVASEATAAQSDCAPAVEQFGDTPALADELAALVMSGQKVATCSSLWEWQAAGEPLPYVGKQSIVVDSQLTPRCIIEVTEVRQLRFSEVDARFARDEGEGDKTLPFWREAHWTYFSRVLPGIGRQPSMDMPLVCERFRVVYR